MNIELDHNGDSRVAAPRRPACGGEDAESKAPPCTHTASSGEDTESKAPPCIHTGRTLPRTHAVPQAGRATAATGGVGATEKVTSADAISEPGPKFSDNAGSGVEFVREYIGGELVMREDCPELPEQITDSMCTRIYGEKRLSARWWARSFLSGRRQSAPDASGPHSMPWWTLAAACACAHTRGKRE